MPRAKTPKQFSAYLVTWSDEPSIKAGAILIDKGARLECDWNVIDFNTGKTTSAAGVRLSRLCPECRVEHKRVGILGHDGDCGSEAAREEAQQVLADAKKRAAHPTHTDTESE
jgi:hypothetical protein